LKIKNKKKKIDFLILDGNMKLNSVILQKSIVKGDEKVFSCAAASILAKVTRDRLMEKFDKKYPSYGFLKHKGYPTAFHIKRLEKHGPCSIHRKTFWPVRKYV
jgi:ribonuclease HII